MPPLPSFSLAEASDKHSRAEASDSNSLPSPHSPLPTPTTPIPDPRSPTPSQPTGSDLLRLLTDPGLSTHLLCDILNLSPPQLAALLESEEVQQALAATNRIEAIRAPRIARAALQDITADDRASPETRRKAASTLARLADKPKTPDAVVESPTRPRTPNPKQPTHPTARTKHERARSVSAGPRPSPDPTHPHDLPLAQGSFVPEPEPHSRATQTHPQTFDNRASHPINETVTPGAPIPVTCSRRSADPQAPRCVIPRFHAKSTLALALSLASAPLTAGPVIAPGWGYPVFQDNFDGGSIDQGVWQVANWSGDNNNEAQYYHPNQVSVSGGGLHLRADNDPNWSFGRQYNSGLVRTWQEWSYGRVEVRAKLPNGQGFWPAIWLLPRTAPWPTGGEIDIMEARGDLPWRMSSALHWGWDAASRQYVSEAYESGANFQAGYHDYAVEWDVGTVGFFVDGVEHLRLYEPAVGIPGTAKSIILNLAVGGDYSGYPDGTTPFPANFDIDYVRVWQRSAPTTPPTSLITDPGFEDSDGALADWPRFGNTIDNVTSDWGTPLDGVRSLKMYGQFSGAENYSGTFQNVAISGGDQFTAGAHALIRSEDSIAGTGNTALLKIEFYSQAGAEYGSQFFLDESAVTIADGSSPEDTWLFSELTAVAPASAAEARVVILFQQPGSNPGGAVFVDSVTLESEPVGCNAADLGEPLGTLDLTDINVFVAGFVSQQPIADLDGSGIYDLTDIGLFINAFVTGCP